MLKESSSLSPYSLILGLASRAGATASSRIARLPWQSRAARLAFRNERQTYPSPLASGNLLRAASLSRTQDATEPLPPLPPPATLPTLLPVPPLRTPAALPPANPLQTAAHLQPAASARRPGQAPEFHQLRAQLAPNSSSVPHRRESESSPWLAGPSASCRQRAPFPGTFPKLPLARRDQPLVRGP